MTQFYIWGVIVSGTSFLFCLYVLVDQKLDKRYRR